MLLRLIIAKIVSSSVICMGFACATRLPMNQLSYAFETNQQQHQLVISIPAGFVEECHERDLQGYLTRKFRYKDGAQFFVACRDMANLPVIQIDSRAESIGGLNQIWGETGSGVYESGRRWSRHSCAGFLIGYDFVLPNNRELFDQAIHSAQIVR
jgi:hypothetical protein